MLSQVCRFGTITAVKGGVKKQLKFEDDQTLFTVLTEAGLMSADDTCQGNKACGKCICKHVSGKVAAEDDEKEFLEDQPANARLACAITLSGENDGAVFEL
uniref:Ferredoxin n=1 Tax=Trichomonas vaginalis TaxID=5722 RepID=FER_TRIVA|nr:RecName: Full=Ferredoxin; Flags: Precursor [Trichomonas vaginalis]AAA30324.1 ferredoxin precursor [Trichomonas vaginalis]